MDKENVVLYKETFFDKIFKPEVITLENGHSVRRQRSRAPFIVAALVLAIIWALKMTDFDMMMVIERIGKLWDLMKKLFHPNWDFFPKVTGPLMDTIKMSILGSVLGATLALPFSVVASTNINRTGWSVALCRFLLNIIRTLPTLIIAKFAALIFGLGTFAGTAAITVFTFGVVSKMMYEAIETIDMGAFEAMESAGGDKFQSFRVACFPQILPTYLSYCLYSLEMNIRAAAILGYVGAGGLGLLINERIGWRDYEGLGMVLLALFVVVFIIENTSQYLRRKLS